MRRPMIRLAIDIAILDEHTRLTRLETDASFLAALGTAIVRCIVPIVHGETGAREGREKIVWGTKQV